MTYDTDQTVRNLEATPTGRFALATLRLAGKLPGATWDEMLAHLRAHPEVLDAAVRIERGLRESDIEVKDSFGEPPVTEGR